MNVKTAFMNRELSEEIYMQQLDGFVKKINLSAVTKPSINTLNVIHVFNQNREQGGLTIGQRAYLTDVLKIISMGDCKPIATSMEPGKQFKKITGDEDPFNITKY